MAKPNIPSDQKRHWTDLIFDWIGGLCFGALCLAGLVAIIARLMGRDEEETFEYLFQALGFSEELSENLIFIIIAPGVIFVLFSATWSEYDLLFGQFLLAR